MKDLLLKSRKEFRNKLNFYSGKNNFLTEMIDDEEVVKINDTLLIERRSGSQKKINELIDNQIMAENLYRRAFILGKIEGLGLKKYSEDIIYGMSKNLIGRIVGLENRPLSTEKARDFILSTSDSALIYGLNYIDDWDMYNDLWKDLEN